MLFDGTAFAFRFGLAGTRRRYLAGLHEFADISAGGVHGQPSTQEMKRRAISRLEKLVSALELLVFRLYDFDTVHDLQKTSLQSFGLSGEGSQSRGPRASRG